MKNDLINPKATPGLALFEEEWPQHLPVTARRGPVGVSDDLRQYLALYQDGLLLVSDSHKDLASVCGFILRMQELGSIGEKRFVSIGEIANAYDEAKDHSPVEADTWAANEQAQSETRLKGLFLNAVKAGATDFHLQVSPRQSRIFHRINSRLALAEELTREEGERLCRVAFAMSDTSDREYKPHESQGASIDCSKYQDLNRVTEAVRLQFDPLHRRGRKLAARFLGGSLTGSLKDCGYTDLQLEQLTQMRQQGSGLVLFVGPMGAGKSTSLYHQILTLIDETSGQLAIRTIEDPVEHTIEAADQIPLTNINDPAARAVAFLQAINATLRSDANLCMPSEVRDVEAATACYELAMTGIRVWTTLHANTAIIALKRLANMGLEKDILFDSAITTGVVAQRLVDRLCPNCSQSYEEKGGDLEWFSRLQTVPKIYRDQSVRFQGPGCDECDQTGTLDRTLVAEFLRPDSFFMELAAGGDWLGATRYWQETLNGKFMWEAAEDKVFAGELDPFTAHSQTNLFQHANDVKRFNENPAPALVQGD